MKLNLGCGFNKLDGHVNIDSDPLCKPDLLFNLEETPWPIESDSVDIIYASHVFEHLGESSRSWLSIWQELWRICKSDTQIEIHVPHPRHDNFLIDPTHVRPIFPETIAMFDQMRNIRSWESQGQETKLGLITRVDFEVVDAKFSLVDPWESELKSGRISIDEVQRDMSLFNNICSEIRIYIRAHKPMRGEDWIKQWEKVLK